MNTKLIAAAAMTASMFVAAQSHAGVQITEFNSRVDASLDFEFVEFTNTGTTPVDMTGWSENDGNRTANKSGHGLSAFGTLQPGESAIFTEASPDAFRTFWWGSVGAAPAGLKIIGPYTNDNLSSGGDEVNLYDNTPGAGGDTGLIDRLTYNAFNGGNADGVTRNAPYGYVANTNDNSVWLNSFIGDQFNSFAAAGKPALIGNPGYYVAVPEPTALGLLGGVAVMALRRRRHG